MKSSLFSLENKYIVVFGGAGYLGSAVSAALLEQGAKIVIADLFPDYAKENIKEIRNNPNCVLFPCSIADKEQVKAAYDCCIEHFGAFNTMINLAFYGRGGSIEQTSDEDFAYSMDGILGSGFRAIREAVPYFERNGQGCIINTASMYGVVSPDYRIYGNSGQNNPVYYGPGKAGIINLTRYAAGHLGRKGIRVNSVTPGPFPDARKLPPEDFQKQLAGKTMLGRYGRNAEIAGAYCYLASDAASFTTGANLVVDGGWTAW